jgi:hypothetical protein
LVVSERFFQALVSAFVVRSIVDVLDMVD